jgi:hypothetical protein
MRRRGAQGRLDPAHVLRLQRVAGNVAVGKMLARSPDQGDPALYSKAKDHLGEAASHFADRWQIQALNAIMTAEEPADATEKQNWYVALAGNVVWVFAGLKAVYWPIALLGAAAGSGVFAGQATPSGKNDYAKALPAAADRIAQDKRQIDEAARECARRGVSDAVGQDQVLWERMFPTFPFDSRKAIYDDLSAWLATELRRFHAAYEAWKRASLEEAARRSEEDYEWTLGPVFRPTPAALLAEVEKDHPFRYTVDVPSPEARAQAVQAAEAIRRQEEARIREVERQLKSEEHQNQIRKYLRPEHHAEDPVRRR